MFSKIVSQTRQFGCIRVHQCSSLAHFSAAAGNRSETGPRVEWRGVWLAGMRGNGREINAALGSLLTAANRTGGARNAPPPLGAGTASVRLRKT
jgi:hypothetical protein